MRASELVIAGVMLVCVAVVPAGWQDRRFSRFVVRGERLAVRGRPRGRGRNIISVLCGISGIVFVLVGVIEMLR